MKFETKFNIGDKVVIVDYKSRIYEINGVSMRHLKDIGPNVEYRIIHPNGAFIWVSEHRLSMAPVIVTNVDCTHTLVHNLSSIYGVDSVPIPEGYGFKCFAHPKRGDIIVSADRATANSDFKVDCAPWDYQTPRIILEKI